MSRRGSFVLLGRGGAARRGQRRVLGRAPRRYGKQARSFILLALFGAFGCAHDDAAVRGQAVVLPQSCVEGPHCVTGQVTDQFTSPVPGVTCSVIGSKGEGYSATTDARGFFFLDRLTAMPKQVRFARPGFESQEQPLPTKSPGSAASIYVTLRRLGQGECTCDPAPLLSGREACPEDKCR